MSEARVHALLEAAVDAIVSIDERGIVQLVNPAAERLFGYEANELIGKNVAQLMPAPFRQEHDGYLAHYRTTGERKIIGIGREVVGLRKDGTTIPIELSVAEARLGDWRVFMGILRDVTERKRAEERFRLAVESAPSGMVMVDHCGQIVLVNAQTEHLFGYDRAELLGQPVELLVPERLRSGHPHFRSAYFSHPQARPMGAGRELYGLRKDGGEFPIEIGLNPIQTKEGPLVLAAIVDITERKRAELTRASLAAIVESSHDAIIGRTLDGHVASWNQGAARLYGYAAEEVLGKRLASLIPSDGIDGLSEVEVLERLERGEPVAYDTVRLRKDGAPIDVSLTVSALRDQAGQITATSTIARDITEQKRARKELEESKHRLEQLVAALEAKGDEVRAATQQLWQAAKLATVGELAASIAHELNNPLATVSLRIESVLMNTPQDDPRRRALEVIEQEAHRMGDLVANLLQFARRSDDKISTVDLRDELTKAVELIQHHLRMRQVEVTLQLSPDTPMIHADRQKLRQVFLNLLTNASDAMPTGGTLRLCRKPSR